MQVQFAGIIVRSWPLHSERSDLIGTEGLLNLDITE
ncbi:hypothetical protein VP150E351_P0155 [Vibrio phage 150E35-1]|nr:hypothetical protein VP150E351_P0155 [Vibrio phage 150E35-1]